MKHVLNTLYITTPKAYLQKEGETVVIRIEDALVRRVPIHTLGSIVCFGSVGCSPYLMELCAKKGVGITFLTEHGRFLCRVVGPTTGNVLLRRTQYEWSGNEERSVSLARNIIIGKLSNLRSIILRAGRDHGNEANTTALEKAAEDIRWTILRLERAESLDELRGLEGDGSRAYFSVFDHMIVMDKEAFFFHGRSRRPPRDNVNCLLSFAYTLLLHDCRSALETVGLDPQAGFLHRDRPGRPSFALDLMEEFRGPLADRLVLSLINRQQLKAEDFEASMAGGVTLKDDARKTVLVTWQKRKQEEIQHPFLAEKMKIGLLPHVQAQLLSKYMRAELDAYPPFIRK